MWMGLTLRGIDATTSPSSRFCCISEKEPTLHLRNKANGKRRSSPRQCPGCKLPTGGWRWDTLNRPESESQRFPDAGFSVLSLPRWSKRIHSSLKMRSISSICSETSSRRRRHSLCLRTWTIPSLDRIWTNETATGKWELGRVGSHNTPRWRKGEHRSLSEAYSAARWATRHQTSERKPSQSRNLTGCMAAWWSFASLDPCPCKHRA